MIAQRLVASAEAHARQAFQGDATGHDWFHTDRVRRVALRLAGEERADPVVVELAALLHDVDDWKIRDGDHQAGPREAARKLQQWGASPDLAQQVATIIAELSFKGAGVQTPMSSIEGGCVQDADRLDAIGAIGIARAFAFGGAKGRPLHDPSHRPVLHESFETYKKNSGPTLNHFYEKLLLLRDRMQTQAGRRWAQSRHAFLESFVQQFLDEWDGDPPPAPPTETR
jgi:uncharacterized protein